LGLETGKFVALHVRTHLQDGAVFNPLGMAIPYKPLLECAVMAAKSLSHKMNVSKYRIAQNFGGRKLWRIWRFIANPPKFYPPKSCEVS